MLEISASLSGRKAQLPLRFLLFRPLFAQNRPVSRRCSSDNRKLFAVMYSSDGKFYRYKSMKASSCFLPSSFFVCVCVFFFLIHSLTRYQVYKEGLVGKTSFSQRISTIINVLSILSNISVYRFSTISSTILRSFLFFARHLKRQNRTARS